MNHSTEHWLSLDLSSRTGSLALHRFEGGALPFLLASEVITLEGNHSEAFIPSLNQILLKLNLDFSSITRFVTCSGPGSFTGLRVALASIKALAYLNRSPIDIVSGSEARGISWIKNNSPVNTDELYVITQITSDKFVAGQFLKSKTGTFSFVDEANHSNWDFISNLKATTLILDSQTPKDKVPNFSSLMVELQPLKAELLGNSLLECSSRKTYQSITDWVNASPNYFGSTRF